MSTTATKRAALQAPEFSVPSGAILVRGTAVTVRFPFPIDRNAIGGVTIVEARAAVALGDDGRTASVDTSTLSIGSYTLRVTGVHSTDGVMVAEAQIVIAIVSTTARIPDGATVHHAARVRVEDLGVERLAMDGVGRGQIDLFKAEDAKSGKPMTLAFDDRGEPLDYDQVIAGLAERRAKAFGNVHESLVAHLAKVGQDEPVEIAIWLRTPEITHEKSEKGVTRRPPQSELKERELWKEAAGRFAEATANELQLRVDRIDTAAPVVYALATAEDVRRLAEHPDVAAVFLYERTGTVDLSNSIGIANSDDAHTAGFTGKGVNVAVYEDGPDDTSMLDIAARFTNTPAMTQHARHTHGIIKNKQPNAPHGHAPDCSLHSANSMDLDAIRWAAQDRGCTVISQSFHRDAEQTSSTLSFDDTYKDNLALHWPYPTICEAAGNGATTEFVNHKGFNRITVGNHDDTATAMASDSVFRNPSSSHADRELPELAANGMGVTTVGLTFSGTSMAAPAVAGSVALIQQANTTLQSWPEGCRAIMLAAARRNPSGGTWRADLLSGVDASDGSGALESKGAVDIARSRKGRNNTASNRGFDIGTIRSGEVGADGFMTYVYRVSVPRFTLFPHVKVALAWDSKIASIFGIPIGSTLAVDLDLHVRNAAGSTVASSASWDNSYEIAEFGASPGETYEIRIRRWSGTDDVWYGIAWNVTGFSLTSDTASPIGENVGDHMHN
jgi:Subtilase family